MNVFVSVPVIDKPELNFIHSLYQTIMTCKNHHVRLYFVNNDSLISRVRNCSLSVFYNDFPEFDYFISLDSDLEILNCHKSNNLITKLIEHNLDFVGGLYSIKKQGSLRCSSIPVDSKPPKFNTGLIEMKWLSTGCWCLKRQAIERMIESYPELTYDGDDAMVGKKVYGLYIPMIYDIKKDDFPGINVKLPNRKYLSEDWSFAQRWKQIGGKIWGDTSLILNHIGKYSYNLFDVERVERK